MRIKQYICSRKGKDNVLQSRCLLQKKTKDEYNHTKKHHTRWVKSLLSAQAV